MKRLMLLALVPMLFAVCTDPVDPGCVDLIVAAPGYELPVDSLEDKGWTILEGDTIAAKDATDCQD